MTGPTGITRLPLRSESTAAQRDTTPVPSDQIAPAKHRVLASFAIPSYRSQWLSDVLSAWGAEMETIILGWYVLVETNSPFLVSLVAALRFGGTLVSPMVGVFADRVPRRTIFVAMRIAYALLAASLAVTGIAGVLPIWYVFVAAALAGLLRPSEMIIRQSLIADTVPRELLTNAMGFSRTTMESARIFGALAGAGLLSVLGIGFAYAGVSAVYVASIVFTVRIAPRARSAPPSPAAPWSDLLAGFSYMRRAPVILAVVFLAFMVNLTAFPLTQGLLPVIARDVFGFDENGLARMVATAAAGALAGSVLIAVLVRSARPERLMFAGLISWHALVLGFALTDSPVVAFVLLALIGVAMVAAMIPMAVLLMSHADAAFRGRVMGLRMLAVYGLPVGLLAAGAIIESLGVTTTLIAYAVLGTIPALVAASRWQRWMAATARRADLLRRR